MRCRLRAGVALVVLGLMWGVLFLVPFAAPWIGFGVLGLPCRSEPGPLTGCTNDMADRSWFALKEF